MDQTSDAAKAEELSRRRARALPVLAIIFLSQQATFFTGTHGRDRAVDHVHIGAWLILSIVMLLAMATGGGWIHSKAVRQLANDEATRAHREISCRTGYLASVAASIALYALTLFETLDGRDALHLVMTIGIAAALLRFGILERRAYRDA
jgi:hypothetical protein